MRGFSGFSLCQKLLLPVLVLSSTLACGPAQDSAVNSNHTFQLAVLNDMVAYEPPGLGYTIDSSWPILLDAYPSQVICNLTQDDIQSYDWTAQSITLTPQSSAAFLSALDCTGSEHSMVCVVLNSFIVLYDSEPLYGGEFLLRGSQAAIRYPVVYASLADDLVTLTIRPMHAFYEIEENYPGWQTIRDDRVQALFSRLGKIAK